MENKIDKNSVINKLKEIYDPEIPVNLVDLGLIYNVEITHNIIKIEMTLTNPACPVAAQFPDVVKAALYSLPDVEDVIVELIWDPPWSTDKMTDAAKLTLGIL